MPESILKKYQGVIGSAPRHDSDYRPNRWQQDHNAVCDAGKINSEKQKIITVEDLEYQRGITQIQANASIGLSCGLPDCASGPGR